MPQRQSLEHYAAHFDLTDRHEQLQEPPWRTASWGYLRFHQGCAHPPPAYTRAALRDWAWRVAALWGPDADVYAFFNNDQHGAAVRDAAIFAGECRDAGLPVSRVPN
jgi:uncharacterized protein YecE (DUF72 family)